MSLPSSNSICAVIPFFNEKKNIREIIEGALTYCQYVVAVNDGSTDGSEDFLPVNRNIFLLDMRSNKGKGNALKEGFKKSIELNSEFTVTIDADLQHPVEFIPNFRRCCEHNDIVIGNRMKNKKGMPFQRIMSNTITSIMLSLKTGYKIFDSQCGYRMYRTSVLPLLFTKSPGYEAESEILILAAKRKLRVDFIDVPSIYSDEESKMKPFQAIWGFLKVMLSE